ncbi:hypothetical protein VTK73DRAFT_4172 [Phialemonium thermophilum]|uniref:DUF7907 domain-containing protein n=1 Tax=Phialemonium thermophilum TaxID=223376 RepID=A0ABR3Y0U8_9PEZI
MKFSLSYTVLLHTLAFPIASGQTFQTGPFALKLSTANDSTLNNQYLYACHSGAAIEALCVASNITSPGDLGVSGRFYLNHTAETSTSGSITWNLPVGGNNGTTINTSEPLVFQFNPASNVAVLQFVPGDSQPPLLGFSGDNLYASAPYDDSGFKPGVRPNTTSTALQLQQWHACWSLVGSGYYYRVLAWVSAGAPRNPTCVPVTVSKENLQAVF